MGISRREFLQGAALFGLGSYEDLPQNFVPLINRHPLNIIQGPTNESVTQIAVDLPRALKVTYILHEKSSTRRLEGKVLFKSTRSYSGWRTDTVRFEDLKLGEEYRLQVIDKSGHVLDERALKSLDTHKIGARVALISCQLDISLRKHEMWGYVKESRPDVIFLHGDNVYGDIISRFHGPKLMWFRYIMSRNTIPFYHWDHLVPAFAVWDDHDFGKNDVDGHYPYRDHSLETFEGFYAQKPIANFYRRGPGVSSAFDLFGHRVLFLDGRYYRGLPGAWGPGFLGDEQLAWVAQELAGANMPLWFASGSQFFGGYQVGASYEEHGRAGEWDEFLRLIRNTNQIALFSSGDLHYSEVLEVKRSEFGFETYEMTSSCLHSKLDKYLPENERRIEGTLKENFIVVDFDTEPGCYRVTCLGVGKKTRFQRTIRL